MRKIILTALCSVLLLSIGFVIYSQQTDNRPANEWWVYFVDKSGARQAMLIETTYVHDALWIFYKRTSGDPEIRVTCVTNPHWNYCVQREW